MVDLSSRAIEDTELEETILRYSLRAIGIIRRTPLFGLLGFIMTGGSALFALPVGLRVEHRTNPLGLDVAQPALSWRTEDIARNWKQEAYQIEVATSPSLLFGDEPDIWDSGRVRSDESVGIQYKGPQLGQRKRYFWRVRTWDTTGKQEVSVESAWWEMGLLRPDAWTAGWISYTDAEEQQTLKNMQWLFPAVTHITLQAVREPISVTSCISMRSRRRACYIV